MMLCVFAVAMLLVIIIYLATVARRGPGRNCQAVEDGASSLPPPPPPPWVHYIYSTRRLPFTPTFTLTSRNGHYIYFINFSNPIYLHSTILLSSCQALLFVFILIVSPPCFITHHRRVPCLMGRAHERPCKTFLYGEPCGQLTLCVARLTT